MTLTASQGEIKKKFDRKSVKRETTKIQVCSVNMLKYYVTRSDSTVPPPVTSVAVATVTAAAAPSLFSPVSDGPV